MIRFKLFDVSGRADKGQVAIDPFAVVSVVEDDQRADRGGYVPVAVIRLSDGHEYTVNDYSRDVVTKIEAAKSVIR